MGRRSCRRWGNVIVAQQTLPGAQLQIDFGEKWIVIGAERTKVHLFVAVLGYSRRIFVRPSLSQRQDHWREGLAAAFRVFGGVTRKIDRAGALVIGQDRPRPLSPILASTSAPCAAASGSIPRVSPLRRPRRFPRSAVIALAGLGLSSACIARGQPTASPPVEETVDVAAVFATQLPLNNTFYAEKWPELFKRILVSPNVVFAAERNSTAAASAPAPVAGDAPAESSSGDVVEVRLSTLLLDYLAQHGAALVVPAALVRWVGQDQVPSLSWAERGILAPKTADADEKRRVPTAVFAVRALGRSMLPVAVVAVRDVEQQQIVVRPRAVGSRDALCMWTADVPVISFSAEVVDPVDGRLVARIDEHRVPKVRSDFERSISYVNGAAKLEGDMVVGRHGDPSLCTALQRDLQRAASDVSELAGEALDLTVDELLRSTLDPLFKP